MAVAAVCRVAVGLVVLYTESKRVAVCCNTYFCKLCGDLGGFLRYDDRVGQKRIKLFYKRGE